MRVAFMGSPDFAVPALRALVERHAVPLVVTQPDKPAGRGKRVTEPPVKQFAIGAGLNVIQPRSARTPELAEALRAAAPDICVVVAYGKILPAGVLEVAPRGCLNIHASLLPRYRGAAPIQWAIINGERETGVCIMQLDEGMDTGPVYACRSIAIEDSDTAGSLHDRLAPIGASLLIDTLTEIERDSIQPEPQEAAAATYAPMLSKGDGLVDWTQPARSVVDRVRGLDPWPGAFTQVEGAVLKLFHGSVVDPHGRPAGPGTVLGVDADGVRVACGAGVCAIGELQAAGKRRMSAAAFAAGRSLRPGQVLGE